MLTSFCGKASIKFAKTERQQNPFENNLALLE